jgi:DNA-binding MarR family transcriptional regulator
MSGEEPEHMIRRSIRSYPVSPTVDRGSCGRPALNPEQREMLRANAAREQFRRRLRRTLFDPHLFGEPGWDILLALYVIDDVERRLSIAELTTLTHVPLTTTLRWLACLEEQGLVSRTIAPNDQRMVLVELTDKGRRAMDSYFSPAQDSCVSVRLPGTH